MPLSETKSTPSGTRERRRRALPVSTVKSFRSRLFTPTIRAPARRAVSISAASWASTRAESPSESQTRMYSASRALSVIEQMSSAAAAPRSFASKSMYSSTVKSLRRQGIDTVSAIRRRCSSLPRNHFGSVSTDTASAPAAS